MIIEVALVCPSSNSLGSLLEYWGFARIFGRLYGMHDTGISINNRASIAAMDFLVTECENQGLLLGGGHSCRWIGYANSSPLSSTGHNRRSSRCRNRHYREGII